MRRGLAEQGEWYTPLFEYRFINVMGDFSSGEIQTGIAIAENREPKNKVS